MTEKTGLNNRRFILDKKPNNVSEWGDVENHQNNCWIITEGAGHLIFLFQLGEENSGALPQLCSPHFRKDSMKLLERVDRKYRNVSKMGKMPSGERFGSFCLWSRRLRSDLLMAYIPSQAENNGYERTL